MRDRGRHLRDAWCDGEPPDRETGPRRESDVDEAFDEAFGEAFDLSHASVDAPATAPSREESGGLVENVVIVDDSTSTEVEADLDAWFDLVGGDGVGDEAACDPPPSRAEEDDAPEDHLPVTASPGGYSRTVRDLGARDSVVDVLVEYLGEGTARPRGGATPEPQTYRRVPMPNGQGWALQRQHRCGKTQRTRRRLRRTPPVPDPADLDAAALDDLVVGGDRADVEVYRSPVPEIRITSVDLDALGQVATPDAIEYLETAVEVLRGIADDCFGAGRHKTVLRTSAASEALAVARPVGDPWVTIALVQDDAGELGGVVDLGMHPSVRRLRAGRGRESLRPLLERSAMFLVRCAQNVYLESFIGQSPVELVADVAGLARFFWSMLPLEQVLGRGRRGDDPLVFNVAFSFQLLGSGAEERRRAMAVAFDVGDGSRATDREEFLPRAAFHHAVICRSRDDHSFMACELYPRVDLEMDADGYVIGPDGGRYSIDLPGVMSHLRI